jgi:hypothetical protein
VRYHTVVAQLERIGEWMTLREAAKVKGTTEAALSKALHLYKYPHAKIGRTIVVRLVDIEAYQKRGE